MTTKRGIPRVYLDSDVYLSVLKGEPGRELCRDLLLAAERGDIELLASRHILIEVGSARGDRPGQAAALAFLERFLFNLEVRWAEVDLLIARQAIEISWRLRLRGADALHLATAVRLNADYFMSNDDRYPFGSVVEGCEVARPQIVWTPTLEDGEAELSA